MNGGIPQGTKLGLLLFTVMVNDRLILGSESQICPGNSPSLLNFIVNEIESYAVSNNMDCVLTLLSVKSCLLISLDISVGIGNLSSWAVPLSSACRVSSCLGFTLRMTSSWLPIVMR